ncbi:DnaB-like helicase N-terminal domain-containing protein [Sulfurimonas sp. NWX79]|uniref:DnaB-like helicase N-terminal domain-containing protein n=1 Tax=Campylobacterales TaxID=213849 RepID=UPI003204770F|nr:replicative DNA helicase [Sulfurimonas phage SNW-1]
MEFYNLAFEQTVLSSAINAFTPDESDTILSQLKADLFYLPAHQNIYNAINTLQIANKPMDEEFIKTTLEDAKLWDENVMLAVLMQNPVSNIEPYVQQLKDLSRKRILHAIANKIKNSLIEENSTADTVQAMIELELQNLETSSGIGSPITMTQAIYDYDHMKEPPKIQTGIQKFDAMLCGGIEPAQLVHLGGEKNVGKTTLLKQVLYNTSSGFDSLFFSFEMPAWKMAKYTKKMNGPANLDRYRIIDTQMMKSRDVMDVVRMIKTMHRKHGIRFVLIDSKMKLTHKTFKGNSDSDRKGDIDAILNGVVQETGIVLMMIVQLSKEDIKNGSMSSYGSGLSDYEADMQIMMYHSNDNDNSVELKVSKNRQEVKHEPIKLWFDEDELKFTDIRVVETSYTTIPNYDVGGEKIEVTVI